MRNSQIKNIEDIIGKMTCPKDFKCYNSGFKTLCKAKNIGLESYLDCLEKNPYAWGFSISFGNGHLCRCPLRHYILKELKI